MGAAIARGYKEALEENMDIVVVMYGDNQMDGKYLPDLLEPIIKSNTDYTKGDRLFRSELLKILSVAGLRDEI